MVLVIYYKNYSVCTGEGGEDVILIQHVRQAEKNGWIEVDQDNKNNFRPLSVDEGYVHNTMIFKFTKRTTAHKFVEVFKSTFLSTSDRPICIIDNCPLEEQVKDDCGNDCGPDIVDMYDSYCGR